MRIEIDGDSDCLLFGGELLDVRLQLPAAPCRATDQL
jgi:hypothetical protein